MADGNVTPDRAAVEALAARMAYDAGLGVSEWEAFVTMAEEKLSNMSTGGVRVAGGIVIVEMPNEEPSMEVGEIVQYVGPVQGHVNGGATEHAAIVTRVWSGSVLNLYVIPDCGEGQHITSVPVATGATDETRYWKGFR